MDKNVISIEEVESMASKGDDFFNCFCRLMISRETMGSLTFQAL